MARRVVVKAAPAALSLWFSMAQGSRLKPLLPENGLLWGGLLLRAPVFDEARGHGGGCSGSPEPLVLDGARVAAEAAPTRKWASVGELLPRAPVFDEARGHGGGCSGSPEPLVLDGARVAAEAAPTKKWASVGGLSPRTSAFEDKRIRGWRRRPRGSRGGGPVGSAREDPGEGYFSSR
jgi:hypothetical protein